MNQTLIENNHYCDMAWNYCKELHAMTGEELPNKFDLCGKYIGYILDPTIVVKKIYKGSEFVGFVIFENVKAESETGNVPFDWFIMESYVEDIFRQMGLMSKAVKEFCEDQKITSIGYVTLDANTYADNFWKHRFSEMGYNLERNDKLFPMFDDIKGYIARKG